ncbi:MAG: hypothetical protein ABIQ66_01010 [Novosphingobium sp.]
MSSIIALIGFGEAGETFARAGGWTAQIYDQLAARRLAAGALARDSAADALANAALVLSLVTADQALIAAQDTSAHYFWGMARNFDVADQGFTALFKAQQGDVFAEDVEVHEAQQRAITAHPHLRLNAYNIEQGGVRARQIINRQIEGRS